MVKWLDRIFWAGRGLFIAFAVYWYGPPSSEPTPHVESANLEDYSPRCDNARGEPVEFEPRQHKVFVEQNFSDLTRAINDKTILYDIEGAVENTSRISRFRADDRMRS